MSRALAWLRTGDRWIPALLVLGFVLVIAVNGGMVWLAVATNPGLVTDGAARAAAARAAGAASIRFDGEAMRDEPVFVRLADGRGRPLAAHAATLRAERPSRYAQALRVPLEPRADGWAGTIRLPIGGAWVFTVRAETASGAVELSQPVEVRPGRVR